MKAIETIQVMEKMHKVVFSVKDVAKITNKTSGYSSLMLFRLKKRGLILEVEKGKYALKETNPYTIVSNLIYPCYISFLTAFSYYNMITQIPKKIQIVCLKSKKKTSFDGYDLKFIKMKQNRFFGYKREKVSRGFIFIAEIEKVIVDSLFLPKYCPIDETYKAFKEMENINIKKLIDYALKMKKNIVLKRLGYLLEKSGIDIYDKVRDSINYKYDFLDIISGKGKKNKKWKLIINRELE